MSKSIPLRARRARPLHCIQAANDLLSYLALPAYPWHSLPHRQLNRLRLICETVTAHLQEQLHLSKHYAKSTWGVMTRMAAKEGYGSWWQINPSFS